MELVMELKTDEELLGAFRAGSEEAFAAIFQRYKSYLMMESYLILRDSEAAKDVVQDLFLRLWDRRKEVPIRENLYAYLLFAVRNNSLSQLRQKNSTSRKKGEYCYHREPASFVHPVENKELGQVLQLAIESISAPACKKAVTLQFLYGKSNLEISREMNITVQVVKNQISRGLKIVRNFLRDQEIL